MKLSYYFQAIRPKTLTASISPIIIGLAFSYSQVNSLNFLLALSTVLCALFLQISTNLVNDYYDFKKGIDGNKRLGPARVTQQGLLKPSQVKNAFLFTFFLAFLFGSYIFIHGGIVIIITAVICFITAYAYTGGPFPLSYYGLGELFAFLFFGPVAVWGVYYIQTLEHSLPAILLGFGPGFISALIMSINNLRDINSDALTKKKTLATLFGEVVARALPVTFIIMSLLIVPIFLSNYIFIALTVLTPILFIKSWLRIVREPIGPDFNLSLSAAGQYMFVYSVTFSLGLLYAN